ncbi:STE-domain-containing protein [Backusella circina FSU 941]|nr:STE-domain-containing protein [Backusella circina FSU 941]
MATPNNSNLEDVPSTLNPPSNENTQERLDQIEEIKCFLGTATNDWGPRQSVKSLHLSTGESISCIYWDDLFHITGTDIVRTLLYRFHLFGRPVMNLKKFEEGIFSDLRNLKPGMDASLEEPKSEFLEMLYKNNCIRTQKKQKVFFWFSVPHDRLFLDALERDLKREKMGLEPTSVAVAEPATSLSLDTTQELFDQLRKSMSLSAVAAAHALDDIEPLVRITDDHSRLASSNWPMEKTMSEKLGHRSTRSLSSLQDTIVDSLYSADYSTDTSPQLSIESSPSLPHVQMSFSKSVDAAERDKQKKIFGAFSLFEGSPTYKQRQRRRTLSFGSNLVRTVDGSLQPITDTTIPGLSDHEHSRLELEAIHAGLTVNLNCLLKNSYKQHAIIGENGPEKVFSCPLAQCGRLFKRLEHLKRHLRTHTMERPYSCTLCGKHFSRSDNLAQHRKTHNRTRSASLSRKSKMHDSSDVSSNTSGNNDNSNIITSETDLKKERLFQCQYGRKRSSSSCLEISDKPDSSPAYIAHYEESYGGYEPTVHPFVAPADQADVMFTDKEPMFEPDYTWSGEPSATTSSSSSYFGNPPESNQRIDRQRMSWSSFTEPIEDWGFYSTH